MRKTPFWKLLLNTVIFAGFLVYLYLLYYFTLGNTRVHTQVGGATIISNFVPFSSIRRYIELLRHYPAYKQMALQNLFGNIILLMPIAVMMPYFIKPMRRIWWSMLSVAVVSILIEVIQFVTARGTLDIDDFIMNFVGGVIAYLLWLLPSIQWLVDKIEIKSRRRR